MNPAQTYHHAETFELERGGRLPALDIAYHTYGELNAMGNNVIWVMHHLTANSDVADWWSVLFGEGKLLDPSRHFIVCANNLGSCYGTTGPSSLNPETGQPYLDTFPPITIRDIVHAHRLLKDHLGIRKIHTAIGGSMGGYQVLEWNSMEPGLFGCNILLATNAKETSWAIGVHETQRMAIELDPNWKKGNIGDAAQGLSLARAIGMLTYRSFEIFKQAQTDDDDRLDNFKASSYLRYQGDKLVKRYNAYSYWVLTHAMDSHNLGRGRASIETTLATITAPTLIMGINSDILCPVSEQQYLADHMPNATLETIDSTYGHDGFMVESDQIQQKAQAFFKKLSTLPG
ncbi:MAG: homoserine O-acetyltransferase [Flavobacteriales bacterium]|nr:homoserine O-acetyltransferase [Flavobacteriales bacterium]MCB9447738.1 homoserine O-acetyltransferase [Flavobacteriales bacterium]